MTLVMQLFFLSFVAELRFAYAHAPRVIFKRSTEDTAEIDDWLGQLTVFYFNLKLPLAFVCLEILPF